MKASHYRKIHFLLGAILLIALIEACSSSLSPSTSNDLQNGKKGAAISYTDTNWSARVSRLKVFWHYSWGRDLRDEEPENVEYVPMFWGMNSATDEEVASINQLVEDGLIEAVLGFNEPDHEKQANMSVDKALALWPKLEQVNAPLGSPAAVNPLGSWMMEFMEKD